MNDLSTHYPPPSLAYSATAELTVELAKMLALVAPTSMTTEQQELWLRAAVDALEGIRANEVQAIAAELKRSVTRHNQIVPEIAKLISEKRSRSHRSSPAESLQAREWEINRESNRRRAAARTQKEIDDSWEWERQARIDGGLAVSPRPNPLTAKEIRRMSPTLIQMGLKCGALVKLPDGNLIDCAV